MNARLAERLRRPERFHCPRRLENNDMPGSPFWTAHDDKPQDTFKNGHGLIGQPRGCSYCGSLPGDDFMALLRSGATIGSTSKSYKVYIAEPTRAKFYFQHLTEDQRHEFFELYRDNRLRFEGGIGFTVLPYFISRGGAA